MTNTKKKEWNNSYKNKDNFIFYPHEEIIRFISKYIKKRIGVNKFEDKNNYSKPPKVLDFGCGIGRHILLLNEFELDAYGFDLSDEAITTAQNNFKALGVEHLTKKVITSNITDLPYNDKNFDFMLSHGVIDSMPYEIAKKGIIELHRVLIDDGLIYFDLIDKKDSSFKTDVSLEKIVTNQHEKGTIQSYFDDEKIKELIKDKFEIIEQYKIIREDCFNKNYLISRYHIIAKKIN